MKLKKYLTLVRAGMMEALSFRVGTIATIIGNLIYIIIIYFLWKAIYASVDTKVVNGMTFEDTMIYLVLASALFYFMELYLVWQIGRSIQSGNIVLDMLKPMGYQQYMFFSGAGNLVMSFFMTFLPTAIVVYFVTKGAIVLGWNVLFFLVAVVLAIIINFYIDFMVGTICLYTESIWGINIMKEVVVSLLSGASVPIAFFPDQLAAVVMALPFQAIYNIPLRLLIEADLSFRERMNLLGMQFFWVFCLLFISKLFWKQAVKQITVNGG